MYRVERNQVPTILLIVLTVVAIGTVAATINNVTGAETGRTDISVESRGGSPGLDSRFNDTGNFSGNGTGELERQDTIDLVICIEFLQRPIAILGIIGGVFGILYGVQRRFNVAAALLLGTAIVPVVWLAYFFSTNCVTGAKKGGGGFLNSNDVMSNQGGLQSPPLPPSVVAGVFGVVVIAGIVMLFVMTGEEETFEPIEEEPDEVDTADFAAAAGRAADRIEKTNVSVDNAVYRAWLEMTSLVDIENPDTTAPMDFADAAISAGLDRDDVSELTDLFNEVRYGGKNPDTREDRAIEILRNIERTYQESSDERGDQ